MSDPQLSFQQSESGDHPRRKFFLVVFVVLVVLGSLVALRIVSQLIFPTPIPPGFTNVHGIITLSSSGTLGAILFTDSNGTTSSTFPMNGGYHIPLRSNILYSVHVAVNGRSGECNTTPSSITPRGADETANFLACP